MNFNNFASMSYGKIMPNFKKTFFINKLTKPNIIPDFEQKTNTLFEEPENYLKLPNETEFNIVVGRKPKGPRFNSEHKLVPYSIVGSILRKGQKKFTKKKSILNKNLLLPSKSSKKNLRFSKLIRYNPVLSLDAVTQKDDKKKKKENFTQLTRIELFDIFNKSKKRIRLNKNKNLHKNNSLCKEIPKIMQQYITEPLSQQERSLKTIEKYNNLINKIENNIFKSIENKNKILKNIGETKSIYNNNSSNLIKTSGTEYRMKIEKINSEEQKKNQQLVLNNHLQNWEMSLRRPKNFIGVRKKYLNIRTDKNPFWFILTEKNPIENEKIVNPVYNNPNKNLISKNLTQTCYEKINKLTNNINSYNDINNLEIKGKKLIDVEEKLVNQMTGNIKLIDLKYDKEFTKDLLFKLDYSINKHSLNSCK